MIAGPVLAVALALQADVTVPIADGVSIDLIAVAPGSFVMGLAGSADAPPHEVEISRPFWIGRTEVTRRQWIAVMGAGPGGAGRSREPARGMSWHEAGEFLVRVSERTPCWRFRLPTEAEWEYAARAGTATPWSSGPDRDSLAAYAWTRETAEGVIRDVARRRPNPWGLHDVHGNVWEWVADWYAADAYDRSGSRDPTGPEAGVERVRRGGSVLYGANDARSGHRYRQPPGRGNGNIGFRVAAERAVCPEAAPGRP